MRSWRELISDPFLRSAQTKERTIGEPLKSQKSPAASEASQSALRSHGDMGSSLAKTGYGCDQVALVSLWRRVWAASSATDPTAPFGICTLVKTIAFQSHVRH